MATGYLRRLERLEVVSPVFQIGRIERIAWSGDDTEEPCVATCEGVTVKRAASETAGEFMARVRKAFPEILGKVRRVWIDQSRPPFGG